MKPFAGGVVKPPYEKVCPGTHPKRGGQPASVVGPLPSVRSPLNCRPEIQGMSTIQLPTIRWRSSCPPSDGCFGMDFAFGNPPGNDDPMSSRLSTPATYRVANV